MTALDRPETFVPAVRDDTRDALASAGEAVARAFQPDAMRQAPAFWAAVGDLHRASQQREVALTEARQDEDLTDAAGALWDAEPYDPFGSDEAPEPDYFGDPA